jgi:ribosome-associated translation inhibitor RaiA
VQQRTKIFAASNASCYAGFTMQCDAEIGVPARSESHPTGAPMKVSISYKHVEAHEDAERETSRSLNKLAKLLKSYEPDLVQLHGVFCKNRHNGEYSFSVNLSLPTGTLHATGSGANVRASCKQAFGELEVQVKKHQSLLRRDYQWKRKRPIARLAEII